MNIKFVDHIPDCIEEKMRNDLVKYEASYGIDVNYHKFALIMTDEEEEAIAVLNGFTCFCEVYIEDLWVDTAYHRMGYGRKLLLDLENRFKGQGFNNINLVTNDFNAPEFYKKCGFELEFTRKNVKNPALTKYFFIKYFGEEVENQGVL